MIETSESEPPFFISDLAGGCAFLVLLLRTQLAAPAPVECGESEEKTNPTGSHSKFGAAGFTRVCRTSSLGPRGTPSAILYVSMRARVERS